MKPPGVGRWIGKRIAKRLAQVLNGTRRGSALRLGGGGESCIREKPQDCRQCRRSVNPLPCRALARSRSRRFSAFRLRVCHKGPKSKGHGSRRVGRFAGRTAVFPCEAVELLSREQARRQGFERGNWDVSQFRTCWLVRGLAVLRAGRCGSRRSGGTGRERQADPALGGQRACSATAGSCKRSAASMRRERWQVADVIPRRKRGTGRINGSKNGPPYTSHSVRHSRDEGSKFAQGAEPQPHSRPPHDQRAQRLVPTLR
mmetsp:Transcript_5192/g.22111  ORF Transcript_5192/g.22111 Transcript_5192/m.22111 type:complete len:258 (-) Transcript_5192:2258-3031(-)